MKTIISFLLLSCPYIAKNTVISSDFLMWQFSGKAQLPHSFGPFARNYAENVPFRKISTSGNQVKLRFVSQYYSYLIEKLLVGVLWIQRLKKDDAYFKVKKIKQFKFENLCQIFWDKNQYQTDSLIFSKPIITLTNALFAQFRVLFIVPLFVYLFHITFGILVLYDLLREYIII